MGRTEAESVAAADSAVGRLGWKTRTKRELSEQPEAFPKSHIERKCGISAKKVPKVESCAKCNKRRRSGSSV